MTSRKRRPIRQEWVRNLARPQVREGVRLRARTVSAAAEKTPAEADLYIYDVIDSWGGEWGVSALDVVGLLNDFDGDVLNVRLNSPGGDYFEGVAILNALQRHKATINVYVDGLAASAASVIAMAGERRVMGLGAQLMIHEASTMAFGCAGDMRKCADMLDQTNDDIAALYAASIGKGGDVKALRAQMAAETWFTAGTAVEAGLATELAKKADEPDSDEEDDDAEPDEGDEGEKAPPFKKKASADDEPDPDEDDAEGEEDEDAPPFKKKGGKADNALFERFAAELAQLPAAIAAAVSRETSQTPAGASPAASPLAPAGGATPPEPLDLLGAIRKAVTK